MTFGCRDAEISRDSTFVVSVEKWASNKERTSSFVLKLVKHLPKLIKWWKMFMATIVYPIAAFTSGLNVFKRDARVWKTMNVRAAKKCCERRKHGNCASIHQKRAEIIAEIHGTGIRNIRSVDLSYFIWQWKDNVMLTLMLFKSCSTFQIARFLVAPSVWKFYRLIVYLSVMLC